VSQDVLIFATHLLLQEVVNVCRVGKPKCAYAQRGMATSGPDSSSFITLRDYYGSYLVKDEEDGR
jgi:hypothetical protein|tara:strand:- start:200 stop:394 length:195 start_codon:yes stop_codon:yes gene_type:complete